MLALTKEKFNLSNILLGQINLYKGIDGENITEPRQESIRTVVMPDFYQMK